MMGEILTNGMADGLVDVAVGASIIKEMWTRLYDQYHEVGWAAESILFRELVSLRQSECDNTDSYVAKFQALYLRLSNMGRKLDNWILVYMLFSRLGEELTSWATTVGNASQKDTELPEFSTITAQLLNESRILSKSFGGTDTFIVLFGKSGKQKFSSSMSSNAGLLTKRSTPRTDSNSKKASYNKTTAKCTHCNKSYHLVKNCWFLHPEKAKESWLARNPITHTEQPLNLMTIGTLSFDMPVDLAISTPQNSQTTQDPNSVTVLSQNDQPT